jgi:hypothetical protein
VPRAVSSQANSIIIWTATIADTYNWSRSDWREDPDDPRCCN